MGIHTTPTFKVSGEPVHVTFCVTRGRIATVWAVWIAPAGQGLYNCMSS